MSARPRAPITLASNVALKEELQARGIPFILATGYGESTLPEKWRNRPRLSKAYRREQLEQLLRIVAGR